MFKLINRIREIQKRKEDILKKLDHLTAWQLIWTRSSPEDNKEFKLLDDEEKTIRKTKEWKIEVDERLKFYETDERYVKLSDELNELFEKLIVAGYFPHSRKIKDRLEEVKKEIEKLELEIEANFKNRNK